MYNLNFTAILRHYKKNKKILSNIKGDPKLICNSIYRLSHEHSFILANID